jgi:two-component system OmpR family response regulator
MISELYNLKLEIMRNAAIIQDHYGVTSFIEERKDDQLIVFIVDDNKVYLNLLERAIRRPNFAVYTFTAGDQCLDFIKLKPDLVLLDYHLDGADPYAKKGNVIYNIIKEMSPESEIKMVSPESKFNLIADLHLAQAKILITNGLSFFSKINLKIGEFLITKQNQKFLSKYEWVKRLMTLTNVLLSYFLVKRYNSQLLRNRL